jgi:microcystin-dependent protein
MKTKGFVALATSLAAMAICAGAPGTASAQTDPYLGDIIVVGFDFCPRGYAEADGTLLSIAQNQALYSLYGTTYGGNGIQTFGLPDLRGRVPVRYQQGPGLPDYSLGEKFGTESVTMTALDLPAHNHEAFGTTQLPSEETPAGYVLASLASRLVYSSGPANLPMAPGMIGNTGGSQSFQVSAPTTTLRYCVATQGIYPSRP